jgi:hypothetical protein
MRFAERARLQGIRLQVAEQWVQVQSAGRQLELQEQLVAQERERERLVGD